jgi:hypothetical protein
MQCRAVVPFAASKQEQRKEQVSLTQRAAPDIIWDLSYKLLPRVFLP